MSQYIEQPCGRKKSTVDSLSNSARLLREFRPKCSCDMVDLPFLNGYERFLSDRGSKRNTIAKEMTNLKSFVRYAVFLRMMRDEENPFRFYKPKARESRHRALRREDAERIRAYDPTSARLRKVRDAFLFCVYTGFRYSDFVTLTNDCFSRDQNGLWWVKKRSVKTGVQSSIPIGALFGGRCQELMDQYGWDIRRLNRLGSNSEANRGLKEICAQTGLRLEFALSWHVSRHTFATLLIEDGVPINVVSKLLGHTSVRMSETYCETSENAILSALGRAANPNRGKGRRGQAAPSGGQ